jgi:hypothetical protein
MKKALWSGICALALTGILCVASALPALDQGAMAAQPAMTKTPVPTAGSPPSDRFVNFVQTMVVSFLIPEEIPRKDGTKIKVDRSDKEQMKQFEIPREDMRRIIHIGYSGAIAEKCDRSDLQKGLAQWVQKTEYAKKKWSERQSFFINRVYWATIMSLTQRADVVQTDRETLAKPTAEAEAAAHTKTATEIQCTDAKKKFVKKLEEFLKAQSKS